jgi:hypothetical protein
MAYWTHSPRQGSLTMTSLLSWVRRGALGLVLLTTNGCGDARPAATRDAGAPDSGTPDATPDTDQPDADATDGDTADAGADVDGGASHSCVSVTGGGVEPWLDLQIAGRQFDAYEGRRIRIVVSSDVGGRLGVADASIANGAFALTLPATFNYGYYTEIALYVDDDADDTCDVGEPLWGWVTGIVQETLVVEVSPDGPCISGGGPSMFKGCATWRPPVGPCVINGQADLKVRLPCPG